MFQLSGALPGCSHRTHQGWRGCVDIVSYVHTLKRTDWWCEALFLPSRISHTKTTFCPWIPAACSSLCSSSLPSSSSSRWQKFTFRPDLFGLFCSPPKDKTNVTVIYLKKSFSVFKIFIYPIPGLLDQLCVELLQVHQQQEHARDCCIPCLRDPSAGVLTAWKHTWPCTSLAVICHTPVRPLDGISST